MYSLLRGSALAVDGHAGHCLGQARSEGRGAGDIARLRTDVVQAAEDHVVDRRGVDTVAFDECADHMGREVDRVCGGQCAAAAAYRGACRVDDVCLWH
ncbi:hypothetical protein MLGJGCBP_00035 [Rhodococcus sp. T7]|nr:hypothetical protein MLGJGCBP_10216 [Rhodococcus sp. T7]KAF0966780.1 hypothetical protein MLGJGCBP_00035 [Rhodococcus sp. T7]